ncbi:hypothetical protein [Mangrovicoccus ximenensis]|uniref:hypothetical protein n=1 Tax=Mangrovicoccus ximenensis TaxID=1911570 RepID=UPI001F21F6B1|nr:hypothetical protein [Mangrovicoccus ximenensis]
MTLLGVEDMDFFLDSRQTELPLVGVSIPTTSFFVAAPILGAALHVYLHLFVRKCTAALMVPPAHVNGTRLEVHVLPWLLNDLVLRWRKDGSAEARPLDLLATVTAILLVWCAGPLALGYAWWRSWPAHDWVMSYSALTCALFALHASLASWSRLRDDLKGRKGIFTWRHGLAIAATLATATATATLTQIKTVDDSFGPVNLAPIVAWIADRSPVPPNLALASAGLREEVLPPCLRTGFPARSTSAASATNGARARGWMPKPAARRISRMRKRCRIWTGCGKSGASTGPGGSGRKTAPPSSRRPTRGLGDGAQHQARDTDPLGPGPC